MQKKELKQFIAWGGSQLAFSTWQANIAKSAVAQPAVGINCFAIKRYRTSLECNKVLFVLVNYSRHFYLPASNIGSVVIAVLNQKKLWGHAPPVSIVTFLMFQVFLTLLVHRYIYTLTSTYNMLVTDYKKAQLPQRERATAVRVWRPTANKCKIRKNLYFTAQGYSRSLLSVSIETRVWLPISD